MGGWDKRIVLVLEHTRHEPLCEGLTCRVEVVQHCIDAPPTHKVDRVCVNARHEDGHGSAVPHLSHADVV